MEEQKGETARSGKTETKKKVHITKPTNVYLLSSPLSASLVENIT